MSRITGCATHRDVSGPPRDAARRAGSVTGQQDWKGIRKMGTTDDTDDQKSVTVTVTRDDDGRD